MSEVINNLDVAVRLYLTALESEGEAQKLCEDALDEIETLRAENKRLKSKPREIRVEVGDV